MKSSRVLRFRRSFRSSAFLISLCGALCLAGVSAAQAQLKVAVVDVAKIFAGYYKTKEGNARLVESRNVAAKEIEAGQDARHHLMEELARIDKDLEKPATPAAQTDLRHKHDDKTHEIEALEAVNEENKASRERQLNELATRVRTQIVEDIMGVLNVRIETNHYDLILNKSGAGLGGKTIVLYANDSLELTSEILVELNKDQPAVKSPPLPEPPTALPGN